MLRSIPWPLILLCCCLAGCRGSLTEEESINPDELVGPTWALVALRDADGQALPLRDERYTVRFTEEGDLLGNADCKFFVGSYDAAGGALTLVVRDVNDALCRPDSRYELYLSLLNEAATYEVVAGELRLASSRRAVLTFHRE